MRFTKHTGYNRLQGITYAYKAYCNGCKVSYHIPRNKETYQLTYRSTWIKSKFLIKVQREPSLADSLLSEYLEQRQRKSLKDRLGKASEGGDL
jgi:hypothetical protein